MFKSKALLTMLMLASASPVFAAATADLRITGTVTPAACTPVFANGGVLDFGNIAAGSLKSTDYTSLPPREITYTITCNAPIAIATTWVDNRADSVGPDFVPNHDFGLGKQGAANIGAYTMAHIGSQTSADGSTVDLIIANTGSSVWANNSSGNMQVMRNTMVSYAPTGTLIPGAYTTYSGALTVPVVLSPMNTLDVTTQIDLDGLATMEVVYP
ncbi:DUF1120 domain-containing protein [Pseudomonas fluorescens]|jgi:type 1 fimbria pilin|uniref:DUF1120 domain-containing protein n=1 Tax=Pseudomonas fluorescens TaxID=294 RepID=UPI002854E440|nr:DUF1120 domain-containing protein [Pseudomonas fluorescens]MDR6165561.1 type 1 fimbria pilin [Pseudomonas fluorescens]